MPLRQQRLNEVIARLRVVLINRHPNWENYLRAIEQFSANNVVDAPPPPLPRDFEPTPAQRVAIRLRVRAALSASDQALLDEILP